MRQDRAKTSATRTAPTRTLEVEVRGAPRVRLRGLRTPPLLLSPPVPHLSKPFLFKLFAETLVVKFLALPMTFKILVDYLLVVVLLLSMVKPIEVINRVTLMLLKVLGVKFLLMVFVAVTVFYQALLFLFMVLVMFTLLYKFLTLPVPRLTRQLANARVMPQSCPCS